MNSRSTRGFSLIELLIVIVIVSILTSIAVASYQGSVRKTRRADAKANLMELAQLLERNFTESNSFSTVVGGGNYTLPYNESPKDSGNKYYDLDTPTFTATTFTLRATPKNSQEKDTLCGTLTLTQTGAKAASGGTTADCW